MRELPEHLRVPWGVKAAVVVYLLPWIIFPIVLILLLSGAAPYVPLLREFLGALDKGSIQANLLLVMVDALVELALVWWYLKRFRLGWSRVGWRKFNLLQAVGLVFLMLVSFTVAVAILTAVVAYLIPAFNANQAQTNEFTGQTVSHPVLTLLALVIIPPIIEETVFRGFIFPALSKRFGLIFGAVSTSILFGFAHLQANVGIYTFVLSLALCFMYVKLRSIFPGMALHMLNNYLAFIALHGK